MATERLWRTENPYFGTDPVTAALDESERGHALYVGSSEISDGVLYCADAYIVLSRPYNSFGIWHPVVVLNWDSQGRAARYSFGEALVGVGRFPRDHVRTYVNANWWKLVRHPLSNL